MALQPVPCNADFLVPLWNEVDNVSSLFRELERLHQKGLFTSAFLVDDGSTDGTFEELEKFSFHNPWWKCSRLNEHRGKCFALHTAFQLSEAEYVVQLDADGQVDSEQALGLLQHLTPGVGAVLGLRKSRQDGLTKSLFSNLGNFLGNRLLGGAFTDVNSCARVYRRDALVQVPYFPQNHRYQPYFILRFGWIVREVPVDHLPRRSGHSRYSYAGRLYSNLVSFPRCWSALRSLDGGGSPPNVLT